MSAGLWTLLLAPWLVPETGSERMADFACEFSTVRHSVRMRVRFPGPYKGKRLAGAERFVGAVAVVTFAVRQRADGKPAAGSIREVVTVVGQSPGLPPRPRFAKAVEVVNGMGSDLQAFGYDESLAPKGARAAEREAARGAWRRYRQELYLDQEREPFAVVEWLHTTTRIRVLRVETPAVSGVRLSRP